MDYARITFHYLPIIKDIYPPGFLKLKCSTWNILIIIINSEMVVSLPLNF